MSHQVDVTVAREKVSVVAASHGISRVFEVLPSVSRGHKYAHRQNAFGRDAVLCLSACAHGVPGFHFGQFGHNLQQLLDQRIGQSVD